MSSVRRRLAGLACLPLLLVSACSDDPPSSAEPTPTVTTSVDPTPTQALETPRDRVPEKARDQSRDGAIAFAKYWVKVRNQSLKSLDTEDLRALSADECETCNNMVELAEEMAANGGSFRGGKTTVIQGRSCAGPAVGRGDRRTSDQGCAGGAPRVSRRGSTRCTGESEEH